MLLGFPGLFDWIAHTDRRLVAHLYSFVADYALYAREHHSVVFGEMILDEYRPSFLVWLTTCDPLHRDQLCELLLGMAMASGRNYYLRPGETRDRLLEVIQKYTPDWQDRKTTKTAKPQEADSELVDSNQSMPTSSVSQESLPTSTASEADLDCQRRDENFEQEQVPKENLVGIYASENGPIPSYLPFGTWGVNMYDSAML